MSNMTIGMMTYSFHRAVTTGATDVAGLVRTCAKIGVQDMDLNYANWTDPDRDVPATLAALEETGVGMASCHSSLDLVTRGEQALAERTAGLRVHCERLAKVKCRHLMLGSVTNDLSSGEWRRQYGIGLAEAVCVAEDYGLSVTFENRGGAMGEMVGSFEHCLEILESANDPRLGFTFDVGNFRYMGLDQDEAFDHLVERIVHVHLKDVVPSGASFAMMPLGEGEVDNAPSIRKLMARGYTGCLAIECGGRGSDEEDAAKSVAFARRVLDSGAED
ncbi:MAG: sugar phosphate isomerase/epimerase [Lentisphaeria bacterium]|nr:sugar phosphate isomerase/epimerase [Lentisphaeria bacterium]